MTNILFIGGAGFIGSSLIKRLYLADSKKYSISVLEPFLSNVSRLDGIDITLYRSTLADYDYIHSLLDANHIDAVIHLVSTMVPGCSYEEYKREFEDVIFPSVRLMQLCGRLGIRFIYFSSGGTIYGEQKTLKPFAESETAAPVSYYGLSKQILEDSVLFEHRISGMEYLILRPSNPYGCGQSLNGRQGLIAVSLGKILTKQPISIWGDGTSVRDYIYIDDLGDIFAQLMELDVKNMTLNIGSGEGHSVNDIMMLLRNMVDEEVRIEYTAGRKMDVSNMILDISRLKSVVKVQLTPLEQGLRQFYNHEKELLKL